MKMNVLWVNAQASSALVAMGVMKHECTQGIVRLRMSGLRS